MPQYLRAFRQEGEQAGQPGEPMWFVASTSGIKRDGLDLNQDLWFLDNYRRNPVFLWCHDYWSRSPIGRAMPVIENGELKVEVIFDQEDDFARQVESKYRRGFLNAVSVGWDDVQMDGQKRYDLLDVSAVVVPADPAALKESERVALGSLRRAIDVVLEPSPPPSPPAPLPEGEGSEEEATVEGQLLEAVEQVGAREVAEEVLRLLEERYQPLELVALTHTSAGAPQGGGERGYERAGAMLSARNKGDLEEACRLIQGVLERAMDTAESDEAEGQGGRGAGETEETSRQFLLQIQQLLIK